MVAAHHSSGAHRLTPALQRNGMTQPAPSIISNPPMAFQIAAYLLLAIILGNVNALVDSVLHPEIPYFDVEHLIVGGVTACISAAFSFILFRSWHHLNRAVATINRLEALLPICMSCKRIRKNGADPHSADSWQSIESYIAERTTSKFSHGICPTCIATQYPELADELKSVPYRDA